MHYITYKMRYIYSKSINQKNSLEIYLKITFIN